jgi:hypothetical protein
LDNPSWRSKKFPILSLSLLLTAYISFGWLLSDPKYPEIRYYGVAISVPMVFAIAWIWIICSLFINPLTSFSRFVIRWFKSDTVAFLSIFMAALFASFILFWLQLFLYILTIIATEALARVDVQTAGFGNWQAFAILLFVSLTGLFLGWTARDFIPTIVQELMQMMPFVSKEAFLSF